MSICSFIYSTNSIMECSVYFSQHGFSTHNLPQGSCGIINSSLLSLICINSSWRRENLFLMWDAVLVLRGDPVVPMRKGRWLLNLSEGRRL